MIDKSKIHVASNPQTEGNVADVVVCHSITDLPIPYVPAQIEHCSKCNERIWVAHTSPKKSLRICYNCALPMLMEDDDFKIMITERQAAEVAWYLRQKK
jgi:hypothetical protein